MTYAVGVLGDGEVSRRTVNAVLKDWHKARPIDVIYVSAHQNDFNPAERFAVDWAETNGVDYGLLMTEGQEMVHLEDYDLAVHAGSDPGQPDPGLAVIDNSDDVFLAWNEAKSDVYEAVAERILGLSKGCYDLTDGLFPITMDAPAESVAESDSKAPAESEPEVPTEAEIVPETAPQPRDEAQATVTTDLEDMVREVVRDELTRLGLLT